MMALSTKDISITLIILGTVSYTEFSVVVIVAFLVKLICNCKMSLNFKDERWFRSTVKH